MLHTEFHKNWPACSGEDFIGFLPHMVTAAILVM